MKILEVRNEKYKNFENAKEAAEWGKEHYGEWNKYYNRADRALKEIGESIGCLQVYYNIPLYCGYKYKDFNDFIKNYKNNGTVQEKYLSRTSSLATSLAFAPLIPENIVVYKIVTDSFFEALLSAYKDNKDMPMNIEKYFSTSLTPEIVQMKEHYSSSNIMLEIIVHKNSFGAYVNGIETCNRFYEQEILFFPAKLWIRLLSKKPYKKYGKDVYLCELMDMKSLYEFTEYET